MDPVLPGERLELVQVCANLQSAETRERETRGLLEAMAETGADHATIVTLAERGRIESAAGPIRIVPAWEWTLEPGGALNASARVLAS